MKQNEFSASFSAGTMRQARRKFTGDEEPKAPENGNMIYVVVDETQDEKKTNSFALAVTTIVSVFLILFCICDINFFVDYDCF